MQTTSQVVTFAFSNVTNTINDNLAKYTKRLKEMLAQKQQRWNGRVLVCPISTVKMDGLAIYDVFTQRAINELHLDFYAGHIEPIGNEYLLSPSAMDQRKIYLLDSELRCSIPPHTLQDIVMNCCMKFRNNTYAIGTATGFYLLNSKWQTIKKIPTVDAVYRIVQLKKTGHVAIRLVGSVNTLQIWDENFTTSRTYDADEYEYLVALNDEFCMYDNQIKFINPVTKATRKINLKCTYMLQLRNVLYVFAENESQWYVYKGSELMYNFTCNLDSNWAYAVTEVSPGIIGFQSKWQFMLYNIDLRAPVMGYPKQLFSRDARLRYNIKE